MSINTKINDIVDKENAVQGLISSKKDKTFQEEVPAKKTVLGETSQQMIVK
jgi:hypothetical protein